MAEIIIVGKSVFHLSERAQRVSHVTRSGGLLFGSAEIHRRLKFTAEKNGLSDAGSESPKDGIEGPNAIELRGSEPAPGTEHKPRQPCCASLMDTMESGGETTFTGNEVRPAFENLRRQARRHGSRLVGKRASHVKPAGGIMAGDDFNRTDRLRPYLLRGVKCILRTGGTRLDLRYVEVTREAMLFLYVCELRILIVNIQRRLRIGFLLRRLNDGEIRTRDRSGERLPGKFIVGFERLAFSFGGSFF